MKTFIRSHWGAILYTTLDWNCEFMLYLRKLEVEFSIQVFGIGFAIFRR